MTLTLVSSNTQPRPPLRSLGAIAGLFLLVSLALGGVLPLWLDEIIQLRETRGTTPAQLIASLPGQPGAAPLGYLTQQAMLHVTGYSLRWARIPSALFVAGTVFVVGLLAFELGLQKPWISASIFGFLPITLRYACESRVYSQALFFSVLATYLFVRLVKSPGLALAGLYCVAMVAAIYSQPYAIFVGPAQILWAALYRERKAASLASGAVALATVSFLPWYFWSKAVWTAGIAGAGVRFVLSPKTPLMLFREVAGAGYWGSGLLLILCILVVLKRGRDDRVPAFLVLSILIPILLALAADSHFGYFVATRQILWVLPAIAIFAAMSMERSPRFAIPIASVLFVFCVVQNVRNFTATRENWQLAADAVAIQVKQGACLLVVPPEQEYSYEFFRPELAQQHCPAPRTAVVFTPYATDAQRRNALSTLQAQGYTRQAATEAGKSEIQLFTR